IMNISGQTSNAGKSPSRAIDNGYVNVNAILADLRTCSSNFNATSKKLQGNRGIQWAQGAAGITMFNHYQTPNDSQYKGNGCRFGCRDNCGMDASFSMPASSWHSGGVNALFCDGSVKFVKDSINRMTWWAVGTRNAAEVISANTY